MKRSELTEFEFEEEGFKLRLSRQSNNPSSPIVQSIQPSSPPPTSNTEIATNANSAKETKVESKDQEIIKSPMVGTFYQAPSPDSPNFVEVGSKVGPDSVVCIIEAMKVMNEIQAEVKGTITEILVENGDSIEFGQPLFKFKKS